MLIERDSKNIIIKLDASLIDIEEVQKFADYFRLLESNAENKGSEEEAAELAMLSHQHWLQENQHRLTE